MNRDRMQDQQPQQIHSFDKDARPMPANNFQIGYEPTFFMLGFTFVIMNPIVPGQQPSCLVHRLGDYVVTPQQALAISKMLQAKVEEYEAAYGRIETPKACGLLVPNRNIVSPS